MKMHFGLKCQVSDDLLKFICHSAFFLSVMKISRFSVMVGESQVTW